MSDVTRILSQIEHGDPSAAKQLLPLASKGGGKGGGGSNAVYRLTDLGEATTPAAINELSVVVGASQGADGGDDAVAWRSPCYDVSSLGSLGGDESFAHGINDLGQIVGTDVTYNNGSTGRAFLWKDGQIESLNGQFESPDGDKWSSGAQGTSTTTSRSSEARTKAESVIVCGMAICSQSCRSSITNRPVPPNR